MVVFDYADRYAAGRDATWRSGCAEGKLKSREDIVDGIETLPRDADQALQRGELRQARPETRRRVGKLGSGPHFRSQGKCGPDPNFLPQQRLTRPHARERHRLHRNRELPTRRAARWCRPTSRADRLRGSRSRIVRAARVVARQRRRGDRPAGRDEALQVQPVVPRQVEARSASATPACSHRARRQSHPSSCSGRVRPRIADDPDSCSTSPRRGARAQVRASVRAARAVGSHARDCRVDRRPIGLAQRALASSPTRPSRRPRRRRTRWSWRRRCRRGDWRRARRPCPRPPRRGPQLGRQSASNSTPPIM